MFSFIRNALHRLFRREELRMASRIVWAFFWAGLPLILFTGLVWEDPTTIESVIYIAIIAAIFIGFRLPVDQICWSSFRSNLCYASCVFLTAWLARAIAADERFMSTVIALIEANMAKLLYYGTTFLVLTGIFALIFSFRPQPSKWEAREASPVSLDDQNFYGPWTHLDKDDAEVIAVHEAGHAVTVGLYRYNLPDLTVAMKTLISGQVVSGYCTGPSKRGNFKTRAYAELEMIVCLAGAEAEALLLGERSSGASADYRRWLDLAERFLATDLHSIFYTCPENDTQKAHNDLQLRTLKLDHAKIARNILEANIEVLEEIRDGILAKRKIKGQELLDMLSRVVSIEGCPIISERTKASYSPNHKG